jgi:hypothetical protein
MLNLVESTKMIVIAAPGGDEVGVYFRQANTKEMHGYQNEAVQRKRNNVKFRSSEAQLKYGHKVMTGIRDGDCGAPNVEGKMVPISSDPQSPDYRENWRELLEQYAPNIIIALGAYVFGGTEALEGEENIVKN